MVMAKENSKTQIIGLKRKGKKQKYTHLKWFTNQNWKIGGDYASLIHWSELFKKMKN